MELSDLKFSHLGVAVKSIDTACAFYKSMGYSIKEKFIDKLQGASLVLCVHDSFPDIELVEAYGDNSTINKLLDKSNHQMYHYCYHVDNVKTTIAQLKIEHKIACLSKPRPAVMFQGKLVSFYYFTEIGLIIELIEG